MCVCVCVCVCDAIKCFFHKMVIEIIFNNEIKFVSINLYFWKEIIIFCKLLENNLSLIFNLIIWTRS